MVLVENQMRGFIVAELRINGRGHRKSSPQHRISAFSCLLQLVNLPRNPSDFRTVSVIPLSMLPGLELGNLQALQFASSRGFDATRRARIGQCQCQIITVLPLLSC